MRWIESEYPRDVVDGLLLAIKESAPKIDTDVFLMVSFYENIFLLLFFVFVFFFFLVSGTKWVL